MTVSNARSGPHRRKALIVAAIVAAVLVGGGVTAAVLVSQHNAAVAAAGEAWGDAANDYVAASLPYEEALSLRDGAVGMASAADPTALLELVGDFASAESITALTSAYDAIVAAYPEGAETASDNAVELLATTSPGDLDKVVAHTEELTAGKAALEEATTALTEESRDANALHGAYEAAYLGVAESLYETANVSDETYPQAAASVLNDLVPPLVALRTQVTEENLDLSTIEAVVTALKAVKASHEANVAAGQGQVESGTQNGSTGGTNAGTSGSKGTSDATNTGTTNTQTPSTPTQPTQPTTPTQPTHPTQPTQPTYTPPSTNVPKVGGGNCAVVGSATSTAGNFVSAPGGVTHYSLSGSGNSWSFTWYTCE